MVTMDPALSVEALQCEVAFYRAQCWAPNTVKTYSVHRKSYLSFCARLRLDPVPASPQLLCMYAAFLAKRLRYSSVKQYLNIIRVLHLEWGLPNPLQDSFHLKY